MTRNKTHITLSLLFGVVVGAMLWKSSSLKTNKPDVVLSVKTNEVQVTKVGSIDNWRTHSDIFIIKDNKTQRKFIAVSGVGIVEDSD